MWSRIWTTCPENPHCGNCGVPFMNSTTSFDFTSLSMNCSMLIFASFWGVPAGGIAFRAGRPDKPDISHMYPKPLCIQSKMARSWHARGFPPPAGAKPHGLMTPISWLREAFFPDGSPYLGQAILGEPAGWSDVLLRTGDYRDENSIRCGHACRPLPVTVLRFRQSRPESGGSLSGCAKRDRAPRRPAFAGRPADSVDAGREPGKMAPRPYHLVLRAIPARRTLSRLRTVPPRLCLPVQLLLCQRRPAPCPPPARPSNPSRRRRDHRLPKACRRRDGKILS